MVNFQLWLERTLSNVESVATFMRTEWGWPAVESVHFIGLTLLFGAIAAWDLRLLGMAKRVPIGAFHRLAVRRARVRDQRDERIDVPHDRTRSVPLQSRVSFQAAVHRARRSQRRGVLFGGVPPSERACSWCRRAARREGVWGDIVDLLDSRHCLWASDYLVSA